MVTEDEFNQVQQMFRKDRPAIQSNCYENQKATHGKYVEKHELLGSKTQKQRKIDDLAEKYAELDKESPKAVKDKL